MLDFLLSCIWPKLSHFISNCPQGRRESVLFLNIGEESSESRLGKDSHVSGKGLRPLLARAMEGYGKAALGPERRVRRMDMGGQQGDRAGGSNS